MEAVYFGGDCRADVIVFVLYFSYFYNHTGNVKEQTITKQLDFNFAGSVLLLPKLNIVHSSPYYTCGLFEG